jgi:serine/threonine-protein kinase
MGRYRGQEEQECMKLKGPYCDFNMFMSPEHTVTLDAFYMDVLEVTNARYAACVDAGVCIPPGSNQSATRSKYYGNPQFDDYPVVFVDWQMARTYCQWRNGDLPTEAQWEKAARGTDNRWFPWGDVLDGAHANFNDVNSNTDGGRRDLDDGYADTAPVNSFPEGASPYGVLNLAGNVWEWVLDEYSAGFYEDSPRKNPIGLNLTGNRVIRGGSWSDYEVSTLWVSFRYGNNPQEWDYSTGFRCVRSP